MKRRWIIKIVFLSLIIYTIITNYSIISSIRKPKNPKRELILKLTTLKSELENARRQNLRPPLSSLKTINLLLKTNFTDTVEGQNPSPNIICPEIFTNSTFGYPFYEKGWIQTCQHNIKLDRLVSLLLIPPLDGDCFQYGRRVVIEVLKLYPDMQILIGNRNNICKKVCYSLGVDNVKVYLFRSEITDGEIWNYLVSKVTTYFVIIGRNLDHWSWFSRIERQIRILITHPRVRIIGGSMRNSSGHWKIGCFQTEINNYHLKFIEGYYSSHNECMVCDHLSTPFMSKTILLRRIKFSENLHRAVLFEDFFRRVKCTGKLTLNCPDILYFATDNEELTRISDKSVWIPFTQKYRLNIISYSPNNILKFSCSESSINCYKYFKFKPYYLIPPCCLQELSLSWGTLQNISENYHLKFEITDGTVLGAVKVKGALPWNVQGNLSVFNNQFLIWKTHFTLLKSSGFDFKVFSKNIIKVFTPNDISIDVFGVDKLSVTEVLPIELLNVHTKVCIGSGIWVYSVVNPGLYARNLYGIEYLRHKYTGTSSINGRILRNEGHVGRCQFKKFHGCVDRFYTDGNLQFLNP